MPVIIDGTNGITSPADSTGNQSYTGTLTGGTGVINIGSGQFYKDASGNLGIGTASPSTYGSKLAVYDSGGNGVLAVGQGTSYSQVQSNGYDLYINQNVSGAGSNAGSTIFRRGGSQTESMRIDTSGNLLVGTTSGSNRIRAEGTANVDLIGFKQTDASGFSNSVMQLGGSRNTTNGTWRFLTCVNFGASADKLIIYDSGNVQNTNNSYGAISDIKLKENIVDATPKLEDLCKVKVRQYNLKDDPNNKQIGVVAQELEEVFAGLVEEHKDKDAEGHDLETTTKSVKYSVFVPMLIKAIQELNAKVDTQALEIQALKELGNV